MPEQHDDATARMVVTVVQISRILNIPIEEAAALALKAFAALSAAMDAPKKAH
jgi:hypothetical protein